MKKHVKKILKKILILTLATSIIFTTCFSHKKINAHAASVAAGLGAYTLYEICLYIGGLAITTLGIGYAYENRDQIAEFGKSVIDSMSSLPAEGWILGSHSASGDYVYGSEALQEVQGTSWSVIQGGGQSPKNDDDNDGDGDKDADDRTEELEEVGFWTTAAGVTVIGEAIRGAYNSWVNKEEGNILDDQYGSVDGGWSGYELNEDGNYVFHLVQTGIGNPKIYDGICDGPVAFFYYPHPSLSNYLKWGIVLKNGTTILEGQGPGGNVGLNDFYNGNIKFETNLPILTSQADVNTFKETGVLNNVSNLSKSYRVGDYVEDEEEWKDDLEELAGSLRSLGELSLIALALSQAALALQPLVDEFRDMIEDFLSQYLPLTDPVTDPIYYPATNPTPPLDSVNLPNQPGTGDPDNPDGGEEDIEIDTDGLLSLFNILFYLIMIIIALIMLFLSFLGFIVMIFRIPASPAMLPEEMILGFEHLQTIMIPGMNISIYGFAMALIYLFIIFAIVKLLRLEINDFKFPRKGG